MPFAQSVLGPEVGGRAIKANMRQSTLGKSARNFAFSGGGGGGNKLVTNLKVCTKQ